MNASVDWMSTGQRIGELKMRRSSVKRAMTPPATSVETIASGWQEVVSDRLVDLLQLPENWDSYGARAPRWDAANNLVAVLASIMQRKTPSPSIVPSAEGHFQAEWHRNGIDLEVEVVAPTKILVSYTDSQDEWEDELDFDFTRLVSAVKKLGLAT